MKTFTKEEMYKEFLSWRNVEVPCGECGGSGIRVYGDTSTWRRGVGGQTITSDVCDVCWGTGDRYRSGVNLRKLKNSGSI